MKESIREVIVPAILFVGGILFLTVIVLSPLVWFSGHANQSLLHRRGIEMPWYQAAFVNVTVTDASVDIKK